MPASTPTRRDLLKFAVTGAAAAALPAALPSAALAARPAPRKPATDAAADPRFKALLDAFADEILMLAPTTASSLGLDSGKHAALKSQLEQVSAEEDARWTAQVKSMAARLDGIDRARLAPPDQIRYDTVRYAVGAGLEGTAFSFGGAAAGLQGGTAPFPVTQQDGAVTRIPEFLNSQHAIARRADADAYLARVQAMGCLLDQETRRIAEQDAMNVRPPAFIIRTALDQLKAYRALPAQEQTLVTSLATRTRALGLAGDWGGRAQALVTDTVYPALERQIAALEQAGRKADDVAGVHRLPDGEAYYRWALKLGTSTDYTPQQVHDIGQEQNRELEARMDAILRSQGLTQGSVGARMGALSKDPQRLFADDERGRSRLIAYCNERVAAIRKLLPRVSHLGLKAPLAIKRVPADIQDGAPLGYMNFASLDGKRPAIYYINLKSTAMWPRHELTSLTAHEGVPGHALQGAYLAEHHAETPLIASLIGFNAFVEGWALYAEQLVEEFGLYADDPFSRLGYLQAQKFRACRLVVDTGMHALKWERRQAIEFLSAHTGRALASVTSEIDRYSVSPGQACGYKMGHNEILRNRERARTALGAKFDLAAFDDALLACGGVPMAVLPTVVDQYIGRSKA
ncbi:DUF885 family protein [Herbaspirillum sp. SJZ107]|uniref:DUF885 domain-containing protein n=1 Tax=Herbaspirillum sp. SJZ107 TaxID=2572881 RepID=UPI00114F2051|nr:DUF885 family protein [Herbaspirillum sp. SJZ107]TQK11903.1 uncharacterized protein (DUF885 family) [Herbaspirillum sp. SJZ107]